MRKSVPRIQQDLQERIDTAGQFYFTRMPATLGNYSGVVPVPDTQNMVYARIDSGQVVKVFNSIAPNIYNWKVFIGVDKSQPGVLKVLEVRWVYNLAQTVAYVLFHHKQHEYPNPDTVWILRDQILPLLVLPAGGFDAKLYGDYIYNTSMDYPIRVADADLDLSSYAVGAGAQYVLLEADKTGALNYIVGDLAASRDVLHVSPVPKPTSGSFPIVVFEFYEGQTELRRDSTERTIIDLRMFTSEATPTTGTQVNEADADTPADGDLFGFWDIVDEVLKNISWANIKATLKTYFDTLYSALGHTHDAADVTYTPADVNDWDYLADPGDTADGLDQLAARLTDLEITPPGTWDGDITDLDETSSTDIGEAIADADQGVVYNDSAGAWVRFAWSRVKTYIQALTDTLYAPIANGVTNGDSHDHSGGDGAQIDHTTLSNIGTNTHAQIDTFIADGWIPVSATWTRTGDHTYTVSGDVTATYRKGTKVRYKDGGSFEYGVIASSSYSSPNTTITLITNSDYAMAAGAITDTYISYIENPDGFPQWFNWTVSWTNLTVGTGGTVTAKWKAAAQLIHYQIEVVLGTSPTVGNVSFTPPVDSASIGFRQAEGLLVMLDNGTQNYFGMVMLVSANSFNLRANTVAGTAVANTVLSATSPFTWAATDEFYINGWYPY